tara:strand:- start:167 stop:1399 length:1233 start_codon:yes stop_codon:yes gene_type:complete
VSKRGSKDNILLLACARAKVYKAFGMARVLCGVKVDGTRTNEPCYASDMWKLWDGRECMLPHPFLGEKKYRLRFFQAATGCDMLGLKAMLPFFESPSAHLVCAECNFNQSYEGAYRPHSHERAPPAKGEGHAWKMRSWPILKAALAIIRDPKVDKKTQVDLMKEHGLNKKYFALDPEYIRGVNPCIQPCTEGLHLFGAGVLRYEAAYMLYEMNKLHLDFNRINIAQARYTGYPPDVRIQPLHDYLKKGRTQGRPHRDSHLRMSSHEVHHWSLHSMQVIGPLLNDVQKSSPAWLSWCALVQLFTLAVQHDFQKEDLERLDDLVLQHSRLFDEVPSYRGTKRPKHHMLTHLARDIWNFGPLRGWWAYGFEGFNRLIKKGAKASNYRNEAVTVCIYWSMLTARALATNTHIRV